MEKQFRNWQSAKARLPELTETGLRDSAHAMLMMGYLLEATDVAPVEALLRDDFGYLNSRADAMQARRFLAAKMGGALLYGNGAPPRPPHRTLDEIKKSLFELAKKEDAQDFSLESAPHYLSVLQPFFARLEQMKSAGVGKRPTQTGDAEFAAIFKSAAAPA